MTAPGYRLVPEEATREMLEAGVNKALTVSLGGDYRWRDYMADLWATMLAAAPQPEPPASRKAVTERAWDAWESRANARRPETPADLVERAGKLLRDWIETDTGSTKAFIERVAALAQEHAAAEKARADKAEKALAEIDSILDDHDVWTRDERDTIALIRAAAIRARRGGGDE